MPVIRWLHRFQAPDSSQSVSALFLWAGSRHEQAAGQQQSKPDPAWRRRALASALLVAVLAGPYWLDAQRPIVVWVDDSLSMAAVENGQSRLDAAFAELSGQVSEALREGHQ